MKAAGIVIAATIAIGVCAGIPRGARAASADSTTAAYPGGPWEVASDSTARPISLSEALELAQRNSPQAVQARGQSRTAAAGSRSAVAAFLPNVSVSAGATRQYASGSRTRVENGQVITLPDEPWSYSAGLGANVVLFGGGKRIFDLQQARASVGVAAANEINQRYQVALNVKQQYFNVLAARESEGAARAQLTQAEEARRFALARVRARTATRSDSLRAEIQMGNAQVAVLTVRTTLESAIASLTRVVGSLSPVTAMAEGQPAVLQLGVEGEALRSLAENGPVVKEAKSQLDAARSGKRASWSSYLPSLTASYSRSGNGSGADLAFDPEGYSYSGSLRFSVSLPLFDQLGREEQVVRASTAVDNAEASLRDARLGALESLSRSLGAFRSAGQRAAAQQATVVAAVEDLRVQQQRYATGSSTLLDVLTSQTQLDQARQALIQARYDQRIAKAELEALVGRDL
jgi:outer membrane protein